MRKTLLAALTITFLLSCIAEPPRPPNILWINAEDISPAWGAYGDELATTPNIDKLATEGLLYRNAFANAPICAPARSTMITGLYATSLGTEHLRSEVPRTPGIGTVAEYLKNAGYWVTNSGKTDYNFNPEGIWDYSRRDDAPWRTRPDGRPFFSILTYGMTHEGPSNRIESYEAAVKDLPKDLFHDPGKVKVPPYYPDTPEIRANWARVYDLITVYDRKVGEVLDNLRADGLLKDTIVFVFSDHGFGMPRYKRWVNDSGLRVPLVVYVPEKFRRLAPQGPGSQVERLVSFVDFAPTALSLAGVPIPEQMQGRPFLGETAAEPAEYVYAFRGRADDMYEVSRAIHTGRYIYTRHYLPHYAYIQPGRIFGDDKSSFRELRKLHRQGKLPPHSEAMWHRKPPEELYDLERDPEELNNLAGSPDHQGIKDDLHERLKRILIETRDVGLFMEPELMIRSEGSSPYEMARAEGMYDVTRVLDAAELVGMAKLDDVRPKLADTDSGVRFWAVQALLALGDEAAPARPALRKLLDDPSPAVAIAAAETLCALGDCKAALPTLEKWSLDDRPTTTLYAARTMQMIGKPGCALTPVMRKVIDENRDPAGKTSHGYKDFNYAAFTGWALEVALENCGETVE